MNLGEGNSGAIFEGPLRRFRFVLWRTWNEGLPKLLGTLLNPSTAAEHRDDPTSKHFIDLAKTLGFGGLFMTNLVPFVSPHPKEMLEHITERLEENDAIIKEARAQCPVAVVGWGNDGSRTGTRPEEVLSLLGEPVYCFRVNKSGEPVHPLYLPLSTPLVPYHRRVR